jgi:nucleoside-diphosphate-sugar epimerase
MNSTTHHSTILVTGADGFIGSYLADAQVRQDPDNSGARQ